MAKLLYIKANPKEHSRTYNIAASFIDAYHKHHPKDSIVALDLYQEKIDFLNASDIKDATIEEKKRNKNHPIYKYAYQFLEADKYVIAAPLWNLGVPAILKAYIDYICVNGITFRYTATGLEGLCVNKKALNIITRGGRYQGDAAKFEFADNYLRTIFAYMGIVDYATIFADELDVEGMDVSKILREKINEARLFAETF